MFLNFWSIFQPRRTYSKFRIYTRSLNEKVTNFRKIYIYIYIYIYRTKVSSNQPLLRDLLLYFSSRSWVKFNFVAAITLDACFFPISGCHDSNGHILLVTTHHSKGKFLISSLGRSRSSSLGSLHNSQTPSQIGDHWR